MEINADRISLQRPPPGSNSPPLKRPAPVLLRQEGNFKKIRKIVPLEGLAGLLQWKVQLARDQPEKEGSRRLRLEGGLGKIPQLVQGVQCILMNPCWDIIQQRGLTLQDFAQVPFQSNELMEKGLIFIWTPKQYFSQVINLMEQKKITYVQNLQVVNLSKTALSERLKSKTGKGKLTAFVTRQSEEQLCEKQLLKRLTTAEIADSPSYVAGDSYGYFRKSKRMLLIFRKHCPKNDFIELRHQRTCDVLFDVVAQQWEMSWQLRQYTFQMIETMLPKAAQSSVPKMLQLFSDWPGRKGWIHLDL